MSVKRALVDCVVLSLQDACLFYPCCKRCFSRIDVEQQDTTRCRCSKCGYICPREHVDHRYRLSLRVARDGCIFGVTVFGACLNQFFGIAACGLQRLVENYDGPVVAATRSTLLAKAVTDCFIGRHFIFGFKITETESTPWLRGPLVNGSSSKDTVQLIASQMFLPNASGLGGCTVISYYRILLQKAAEYELESTDPSNTARHPAASSLLLIPLPSPASSWSSATQPGLSQSLQRSQFQDCTLTPTPPWQQSLGLVTSSAEQEEGCSTQGSGDENSRQTANKDTPHHALRGCLQNLKATEGRALSPLPPSLDFSTYSCISFAKYPHSSVKKAVGNTLFTSPSPGHNSTKSRRLSPRQLTQTFSSSSLVWEDLPFSESLTEFVCVENKDSDIVSGSEHRLNVQNHKEMAINNMEVKSSTKSPSVCQSNTETADSHSRISVAITNTPAPHVGDRHDISDLVRKNPVSCVNDSQAKKMCSHECHQEDKETTSLCFEKVEEEQLEGDTYNCSADLFSSSLVIDKSTNTLNAHAESASTTTEVCPLFFKPDKHYLRRVQASVPHSTPVKQTLESNKCINRDSVIPPGTQDLLDFIPPSQSTPIVTRSAASSCRTPTKSTSSLCKLNYVSSNRLTRCGKESTKENLTWGTPSSKHSHRFTPKKRFWNPSDKSENQLLGQHYPRGALNKNGTIFHKCDSSDCDCEDREVILVPPTPAAETWQSVKLRRSWQPDNSRGGLLGDGVQCKRSLLDQSATTPQRRLTQTGKCDSDAVDEGPLDGSHCNFLQDENQDWSRDLFSDSV